jgi:transposase-like protein
MRKDNWIPLPIPEAIDPLTTLIRREGAGKLLAQAVEAELLSQSHYVYLWADGVYFNVRSEDEKPCILVRIGATEQGTKALVAIANGYRESEQS